MKRFDFPVGISLELVEIDGQRAWEAAYSVPVIRERGADPVETLYALLKEVRRRGLVMDLKPKNVEV